MTIAEQVTSKQADTTANADEQTRARYPDDQGYIERDGVRVFYEVYGSGEPTILFCPTWTLVHSRVWKMQIPYLARHHRVVVFDPRGNGKSDRPPNVEAYAESEFAQDALDVLDATGTEQAFVVGLSRGTQRALLLAAEHPERVLGLVFIGPWFPASRSLGGLRYRLMSQPWARSLFTRRPLTTRSWAKFNAVHFRRDFRDFVEWFAAHGHQRGPLDQGIRRRRRLGARDRSGHADPDRARRRRRAGHPPRPAGARPPRAVPRARDQRDQGQGHEPRRRQGAGEGDGRQAAGDRGRRPPPRGAAPGRGEPRDPRVRRSLLPPRARRSTGRAAGRARCTSARRSASATPAATSRSPASCARWSPTSQIDWLAQDPVTRVLEAEGERIHPASAHLANESAHIESESAEHDLHVLPGDPAHGRDPDRELHGLRRRRQRDAVRPLDRRRGLGARLPPAREPSAESAHRSPG